MKRINLAKGIVISIILIVIGLLIPSCTEILSPDANGRWNPADPSYDPTTDPDIASLKPTVTITQETQTDNAVVTWNWTADIEECTFRYAVNQNQDFEFSDEEYGSESTADATGADGTWYCYVQAKSPASVESDVESVSAVIDASGPDCVLTLVKPETGYYTGKASTINVSFVWSVDDDSEVVSYVLRVGNDENIENATVHETFDELTSTSLNAALASETHGQYFGFWQVGAVDVDGNVTWSAVRQIRVGYAAADFNGDGYADILAGAPYYNGDIGKVYLIQWNGTILQKVTQWTGSAGAYLGQCLNFMGDYNGDGKTDIAIGDPEHNQVQMHISNQDGFPETDYWMAYGSTESFGSAMAGGDFNGDGYDDLAIGAQGYSNSRGKIYLYFGNALGTSNNIIASGAGDAEWLRLGASLVMADVNNDGYDDLIAGAPGENDSTPDGLVYIYFGSSTPDLSYDVLLTMNTQTFFGYEVAADDINGDGYADIVVGAPGYDQGANTDTGAVYVFQGGESISGTPTVTLISEFTGINNFKAGYSVDCGDVTGDGLADVLIGSPGYYGGQHGAFWLYPGTSGASVSLGTYSFFDGNTGFYAGQCVSVAGDINRDGRNDIMYVIPGADPLGSNEGQIKIMWGAASPSSANGTTFNGESGSEQLGGRQFDGATFNVFEIGRTLGRR